MYNSFLLSTPISRYHEESPASVPSAATTFVFLRFDKPTLRDDEGEEGKLEFVDEDAECSEDNKSEQSASKVSFKNLQQQKRFIAHTKIICKLTL